MIFATDLDRTMIYSKKFININEESVQAVEVKEDRVISYMTNKSIDLLKKINEKIPVIPVTTRSLDEYKRINIFEEINPRFFIVNNGGKIFVNGVEDKKWKKYINKKLKYNKLSTMYNYFIETMKKCNIEILREKNIDNMYYMFIIEDMPTDKITDINEKIQDFSYSLYKTGRKVYLVPDFINKWDALNYLRDEYFYIDENNLEKIAYSGDSNMDLGCVLNSDLGIVPKHGEIALINKLEKNIIVTQKENIVASDEILNNISTIIY